MKVEFWPIEKPQPYDKNPRVISDQAVSKVAMSLREYGFQQPIVVDKDGIIIAGHTRLRAAKSLGLKKVPVVVADLPEEKARAYRLADNRTNEEAEWADDVLGEELDFLRDLGFDLALTGFDPDELTDLLGDIDVEGATGDAAPAPKLADKFLIPPFSVLNAREGWWQDRKKQWLALGITSELGRGAPIGGAPMPLDRGGASKAAKNGAVPGGGGKTAIYRKGASFKYESKAR